MTEYLLHVLSGWGFQATRFDGDIALRLSNLIPNCELVIHTFKGNFWDDGRWTFSGGTVHGALIDFFVLEHLATGDFKVIDFQDSYTVPYSLRNSPQFKGAAVMMFHPPTIHERYGDQAQLFSPGWFTDQDPTLVESFRSEVEEIRQGKLDHRLYFRGTIDGLSPKEYKRDGRSIREVAVVLKEKYPDEVDISGDKLDRPEWFREAARHRIVLTLPGHPWCYREFEMMHLGIPLLTYRWTSFLYHQPVHYIAVEGVRQHAIGFAEDPEQGADAIMKSFRNARDNAPLLAAIGKLGQRWYDRYWTPQKIAEDMAAYLTWWPMLEDPS